MNVSILGISTVSDTILSTEVPTVDAGMVRFEQVEEGKYFVHNGLLYKKMSPFQAWCGVTRRFAHFDATKMVRFDTAE